MDEHRTPSTFDRKRFFAIAVICLLLPFAAGIFFGVDGGLESQSFGVGIVLALASVIVWVACLVLGIVLVCMRRRPAALATLLGALAGGIVGFGGCFGVGALMNSL